MATHIHNGNLIPSWCPYTGAVGKKDFIMHGGDSWACCFGTNCPKSTIHSNVYGNLFLQCGGTFEGDASNINSSSDYASERIRAVARKIAHIAEDGFSFDEILKDMEKEIEELKIDLSENIPDGRNGQ